MDKTQQVLEVLKPRVKALGFNKKELEGVAKQIANNLNLSEDASDEDVTTAISTQIDAVVPFLQFGQSQANRVIESFKKTITPKEEETELIAEIKEKESNEMAQAMKDLLAVVSGLKEDVKTLRGEKIQDNRKNRLENLIKDTGTFGALTMKQFSRMSFKDDEEFDTYMDEVEADLKAFNQERADAGLKALGQPTIPKKQSDEEPYSDAELEQLAIM